MSAATLFGLRIPFVIVFALLAAVLVWVGARRAQ